MLRFGRQRAARGDQRFLTALHTNAVKNHSAVQNAAFCAQPVKVLAQPSGKRKHKREKLTTSFFPNLLRFSVNDRPYGLLIDYGIDHCLLPRAGNYVFGKS